MHCSFFCRVNVLQLCACSSFPHLFIVAFSFHHNYHSLLFISCILRLAFFPFYSSSFAASLIVLLRFFTHFSLISMILHFLDSIFLLFTLFIINFSIVLFNSIVFFPSSFYSFFFELNN